MKAVALLLDGCRGIYIPRDFVQSFDLNAWNIALSDDDLREMQSPDSENYWDIWDTILNNAKFTQNGHTWTLYQDGDLWAICPELMTEEEKQNFGIGE